MRPGLPDWEIMPNISKIHPTGSRRGRPRKFDREEALCTALKVFWENGYENTTMRLLSEKMGIGSPSIYCAFGSKADLFIEALRHYRKIYWQPLYDKFFSEKDIYAATRQLFDESARVLLSPAAPCGCLTVRAAMCMPYGEEEVNEAINALRAETQKIFRDRLLLAIQDRQLPADCNVPAISGALTNYFEGLGIHATEPICQAELIQIAILGVNLLPAPVC